MKKSYILLLIVFTAINCPEVTTKSPKINQPKIKNILIGIEPYPAGFFHNMIGVINKLNWADQFDLTPVVYWGPSSQYYQKEGYNGATDPWEYYFAPVSSVTYEEVIGKSETIIAQDRHEAPDMSRVPATDCDIIGYHKILDRDYRRSIKRIIDKYIKIKPVILDKVDTFCLKNFSGKKTIGIHLRGTDKESEAIPVPIDRICSEANAMADQIQADQFFIATDDTSLLTKAEQLLKRPIITYDSYRGSGKKGIHLSHNHDYSKAKLGEEVLIEALLLSRCDKFIHTRSNVSSAVLLFNPELDNTVLYDVHRCPLK